MELTTLAKLKAHLGLPSNDTAKDAVLSVIIAGSSRYIETQTARHFELQSHTLKLDGDGTDMLMLPEYPVLMDGDEPAISVLKIGDTDILSEIASGDVDVDSKAGILYRSAGWLEGRRNITITFSAGYILPGESAGSGEEDAPDLPDELELACIRLSARVYERRTAEGVSNVSTAGFSANYAAEIDDDIQAIIGANSRMRVG